MASIPSNEKTWDFESNSHILIVKSCDPDITYLSSLLRSMHLISDKWPSNVNSTLRVAISHFLIVISSDPVITNKLLFDTSMHVIETVCPSLDSSSFISAKLQNDKQISSVTKIKYCPSRVTLNLEGKSTSSSNLV